MSAISVFSEKFSAYQARQDTAIDGLVADVKSLNDKIAELQASQGQVTPEDQTLIDAIEAKGLAAAEKLEALDAQTAPAPPTT